MMRQPFPALSRLHDFRIVRPAYESLQADTFAWLAAAHEEAARQTPDEASQPAAGRAPRDMGRLLARFGCGPDKIARRGHELDDFLHTRWDEMRIHRLAEGPDGAGMGERTALFTTAAMRAFAAIYDGDAEPPDDIVHVTCTGYASPSAAQRYVAARGWGARTRVLHAYHMGCYAAVPAVRIATGLVASGSRRAPTRADVVHTEVCSLHLHPREHTPEQLVVQSLFADGHVRYGVSAPGGREKGFDVLAVREELAPDSTESMTWTPSSHGMAMTLARDVPARIGAGIRSFVASLYRDAGLDPPLGYEGDVFAVHPGGPRIIDAVASVLELREAQVAASRDVLLRYGNMSSATLPHVWKDLLDAGDVASGTRIVSLAFGPGLTLAGALLVKA